MRKNICKVCENDNSVIYKAICNCGCADVDHIIDFEIDKDGFIITTFFYKCLVSNYYYGLWRRLKTAVKVLFGFYVDVEGEFIFDEEGLADYIKTLEEGLEKLISRRAKLDQ